MARVIALAQAPVARFQEEILRMLVVSGCALTLIAAGHALPV